MFFFYLESVAFSRVYHRFGLHSPAEAAVAGGFAFNQGFYNLFLALGVVAGLYLGDRSLVWFGCAVMIGAGLVLVGSSRRMWRAALIQAAPPAIALLADILG